MGRFCCPSPDTRPLIPAVPDAPGIVPLIDAARSCRAVCCAAAVFAGIGPEVTACAAFLPCRDADSAVAENAADAAAGCGRAALVSAVPFGALPGAEDGREV
ncbi:hypothetical protein SDC9_181654 [bioreactor metagenome]|uniref:Uncharacterized protein n=1 Tax=bioreactor metagenome TaxID=1076179 RepID=A0A645H546_9ZZZZ